MKLISYLFFSVMLCGAQLVSAQTNHTGPGNTGPDNTEPLSTVPISTAPASTTSESAVSENTESLTQPDVEQSIKKPENGYQIELIIFSQTDTYGDEEPDSSGTLSYPDNFIHLADHDSPFTLVAKSERKLGPDAYTLGRSERYRVLYHQAWKQTRSLTVN